MQRRVAGQADELTLIEINNKVEFCASISPMRVAFLSIWAARIVAASFMVIWASPTFAADADAIRPYFYLGAGGTYFSDADQGAGLELENPSQFPFPQLGLGVNLNRYWGVELTVNYVEAGVELPSGGGHLGEYSLWTFIPQLRLRYPLLNDRLVPYAIAGAGLGLGEFNDRNPLNAGIQFGGSRDTSFVAAAGLGFEYFVAPNIALGVEAKHIFGFKTDISFGGQAREFDLDNTLVSAGMRLFLDGETASDTTRRPLPADSDRLRGYVLFHTGGAFFSDPDGPSGLERTNPVKIDFGAGAGVNFNKHWGAELAWDFLEPTLSVPGIGEVAELTLWTVLAQLRYRYPVFNDRLVPYLLVGVGVGVSQLNDRRVLSTVFPLSGDDGVSPIGSAGGGIEYFLAENIALGIEARYLFGYDQDVEIGGISGRLKNDMVLLAVSLRVLFP